MMTIHVERNPSTAAVRFKNQLVLQLYGELSFIFPCVPDFVIQENCFRNFLH